MPALLSVQKRFRGRLDPVEVVQATSPRLPICPGSEARQKVSCAYGFWAVAAGRVSRRRRNPWLSRRKARSGSAAARS